MAGIHTRTTRIGTDDAQTGQDLGASIPALGEAALCRDDIEVVDVIKGKSKAEEAAFMEEKVTIIIEEDDDPNAPLFVHAGHNGVTQYIKRGEPQVIKRKFLYSLLSAKHTSFACSYGRDAQGGEFNRMNGKARTTHRLHVERDDNPAGRKWFTQVLQQA